MFEFDPTLSTAVECGAEPRPTVPAPDGPLSGDRLARMQRYWQAANYLTIGQIYLGDNPLLREPLAPAHVKPRLLGHWGTSAGQNFVYVHVNRLITERGARAIYISGPGHGGPSLNAHAWLEGTYSAVHPEVTPDAAGLRALFRSFSTPGGIPSHCGPHVPNSIHEGGELGYSLLHAYGAAFDNPELLVVCVVGDGEAETGPLEGSWKGNKFLNPARDGAVLPILHLNGHKISGPTVMARMADGELAHFFRGHGYEPYFVCGDDPPAMHQRFASALDRCWTAIGVIQGAARRGGSVPRRMWPMIVLRTPKGWTGPKEVNGVPVEGTFRAHQVPLAGVREDPEQLARLETWLRSYRPEEQFDAEGRLVPDLAALAPRGDLRMGASPHVNGGRVLTALDLPDVTRYALAIPAPGAVVAESTRPLGEYFRDVIRKNPKIFRLFCPDETNSNRLNAVFEATTRCTVDPVVSTDDHLGPDGRVMEVLSEHCCQGWLEGYLLTGRHGAWVSYEAFAQVVDSMLTQHAKWLEECREYPWRHPIASLNVFLTSVCWRNDHNGFSHQAPGFVDNALVRSTAVIRAYYPPDANSLLSVFDHCLRSRNHVNIITCDKQSQLQWLTMEEARAHCTRGASRWAFASNDDGGEPDVVLACCGDIPTAETVAAAWLLRKHLPELKVRVVNVVDLGTLMPPDIHPHGMDNLSFEELFPRDRPVVFAHHGYPWVIHPLVHGRSDEARFHVRGFIDRGTTTTPFDMVVLNRMSRFHLAMDAMRYVPRVRTAAGPVVDSFERKLYEHHAYIREHLEDMPEIRDWYWTADLRDPQGPPSLASGHAGARVFTDA